MNRGDYLEDYLRACALFRKESKKRGKTEKQIDDFLSMYGEGTFLFAKLLNNEQK